jgi:hypothetical protein
VRPTWLAGVRSSWENLESWRLFATFGCRGHNPKRGDLANVRFPPFPDVGSDADPLQTLATYVRFRLIADIQLPRLKDGRLEQD